MIEPGEYKTKGGWEAVVNEVNSNGGLGWVYCNGADADATPLAWRADGTAKELIRDYDLDILRTITIPESELPEPVYASEPMRVTYMDKDSVRSVTLNFELYLRDHEAAEAWRRWWRDNVVGGGRR